MGRNAENTGKWPSGSSKKNSVLFLIGKHHSPKFRTRRGRFFVAAEASGRKWRRWRGRWRGARTQRTCWRGRARPLSLRTRPDPDRSDILQRAGKTRGFLSYLKTSPPQSTYIHREPQCVSPRRNWDSPTLSPASGCAPPGTKEGWGTLACGRWRGGVPIPMTGEKT